MIKSLVKNNVKTMDLGNLHMPVRVISPLRNANIKTIGDLIELDLSDLLEIHGLGIKNANKIIEIEEFLYKSINEYGEINWFTFWDLMDIKIILPMHETTISMSYVMNNIPDFVQQIIYLDLNEKAWLILQRRYQLRNAEKLTLNDLGIAFSMSRERVRQIESKTLKLLFDVLIDNQYSGKPYHVHPEILSRLHELYYSILSETRQPLLEEQLIWKLEKRLNLEFKDKNSLFLIFTISELSIIEFSNTVLQPIWGEFDNSLKEQIQEFVILLHELLTQENSIPISEVDILINLNKNQKKKGKYNLQQFREYARLCNTIELTSNGFYQGKFEYLTKRASQVERILYENGKSMHISKIVRQLNHRIVNKNKKLVNKNNLVNQISDDPKFTPIGKSGEWGLSNWSIDSGNIIDLMKRALTIENRPLSIDEIYTYVSKIRPVNKSSIIAYLSFDKKFVKVDYMKWVLETWTETIDSKIGSPEKVGRFIERVFRTNKTQKLEYSFLKNRLMEEAKINKRQAQGLLNSNPVIKNHREKNNILYSSFVLDWENELMKQGGGFRRKKKTIKDLVEEKAREILEKAPGKQIALSQLIQTLLNKFDGVRSKNFNKTLYQYISQLKFIDKFTLPDSNVILCRLKSDEMGSLQTQVEMINSLAIKSKLSRALTFLNENDVDVALFLISKEFEATLSRYLEYADRNGKLSNSLPLNLNLDGMINFVKKEGIITDQAILHFLRQKRNDRAHGTMPSLEERQMMMKHSNITAGMYIDYIKFFNDLTTNLLGLS